ncbi:Mlp2p [Saccharomyces cerevisiae YJM1311]|nr:Mlp2p [Saccharomyces cerevisiae YJM1311]
MEDKISEFLNVPFESLQGVTYPVLKKLYKKIAKFERSEEEVTKLNVLVDEIKSQYYSRISKLKQLLDESSEQKNTAKEELNGLKDQLNEERSRYRREIDALKKQLHVSHEAMREVNDEKRVKEEYDVWQSRDQGNDSLNDDLNKENKLLRRKLMEMENILQRCKSNAISLQLKYDTSVQEKELMLQSKKLIEEKLSSFSKKTLAEEVTKSSHVENLEEKLYQMQTDYESVFTYNKFLLNQNKQLSQSVEEKVLEMKNLKDTASVEKAEFSKEMTLQKNMNDLLRSQLTSLEKDCSLRAIEKNDDNSCRNPEHTDVIDELIDTKLRLEKSKNECQRLQNIVMDCTKEEEATMTTSAVSPTVGKLFSDIKVLKRQLIKERNQKFQLQNQLEDFILELEHKTPELISFKERTKSLEHELKRSTELLETVSLTKRKQEREITSLRQKINGCEANIHSLVKQRLDLACQVKLLLLNTSAIQETASPLSQDELISLRKILESSNIVNENDSQAIITERLVEFSNVNELQEKNVELLNCIRILADKLENYEGKQDKTLQKVENQTIKEAKDAIIELENINAKMETRINILLRERDSYKLLASTEENKANTNSVTSMEAAREKKIRELEAELSSTKVENSAIIQNLRKELLIYKKSQCDKKTTLEDFENFKGLAKEKERMLEEAIDHLKAELEKQKSWVPSYIHVEKERASTELSQSRIKIKSLEYEISKLKKETASFIPTKESLTRDFEQCCKEKKELQMRLKESEISHNENKMDFSSKEGQYKAKIKELENSLERLRSDLQSKIQEIESIRSCKGSQLKWAQNTIDDTEMKMKSLLTELSNKETTIEKLSSEIESLDKELRKTKFQYKFLDQNSDASTLEPTLRKELEQIQVQLKDANSQIQAYEEIISSNENALIELKNELAKTKENYDAKIELEKKEKWAREEDLSRLRGELGEIRALQPKLKEGALHFVQQSEKLRNEVERIQKMLEKIEKMSTIVQLCKKKEMSQYQSTMKENKDLSELVIRLEKDAADCQAELTKTKSSLYSTQDLLDKHERKWMEEKADYERELISNIEQTESLRVENSVLIEKVDDTAANNGDKDHLKLVSLFSNLRHERNSLETKLTTCKRELAFVKQKNDSLEKTINDLQRTQTLSEKEYQCSAVIIDEFKDITKEVTQVNILKENNAILQKSLKNVTEKNREIYKQLNDRQEEISRLQRDLIQTKEQVSINSNKILVYESEMEQCKQRYQDLSQQQKDVQKKDIEKLTNEISDLKGKLSSAENANADLENKFNRLKKQAHEKLDASKKQQAALTNELNELKAIKDKLEQDLHFENAKVIDLDTKLKAHELQSEDVSRDHEKDTYRTLMEEIESLKKELQIFKTANSSSDAFEKLKVNMEKEKDRIIDERTKEFEKKLQETLNKSTSSEAEYSKDIETLKKEWLKEYEDETLRRIKEAEENLKKRIRLPSEERIQKIISKRKEELEEEFRKKLKENAGSLTFLDNKGSGEDAEEELWNSPSKGNSERPSAVTGFINQKNLKPQEQLKNVKNDVSFNDSQSMVTNKENNIVDSSAAGNKAIPTFSFGKPFFSSNTSSLQSFQNPFTASQSNINTNAPLRTLNIQPEVAVKAAINFSNVTDLTNNSTDGAKITEIGSTSKRPIESGTSSDPDTKKVKESPANDQASNE